MEERSVVDNRIIKKSALNIAFTLFAQIVTLVLSYFTVFSIPGVLTENDYGLFQLFLAISTFVGVFHLGLNDGFYLKYGGKKYDEIPHKAIRTQMYIMLLVDIIAACAFVIFGPLKYPGEAKSVVYIFFGINIVISVFTHFLTYVLQATNRVKTFSLSLLVEKVSFVLLILYPIFVSKNASFELYVVLMLISKLSALVFLIISCRKLVFGKVDKPQEVMKEMKENISVGFKLLLAHLASMLILNIGRLFIEAKWGTEAFGSFSFAYQICSSVMTIIASVSIVIFPILKQINIENAKKIYSSLNTVIMTLVLFSLIFYKPLVELVILIIPKYAHSLEYLPLMLPMIVFEGKLQLLIITYYKTFRKEKELLIVNLVIVSIAVILSAVAVFVLESAILVALFLVIALCIQCYASEVVLHKSMGKYPYLKSSIEIVIVVAFILLFRFIENGWYAMIAYAGVWIIYTIINSKDIFKVLRIRSKKTISN